MRYVNEDWVPGFYVTLMLTRRMMRSTKIHSRSSGLWWHVNANRCDRQLIDESIKTLTSHSIIRECDYFGYRYAIIMIKTNFGANDIVFTRIVVGVHPRRHSEDRYFVEALYKRSSEYLRRTFVTLFGRRSALEAKSINFICLNVSCGVTRGFIRDDCDVINCVARPRSLSKGWPDD